MLLALTSYQLALLCVAALFIAFALVVALVLPRSRPEFPGAKLGVFLAVCAALFVAQISAVLVLAYVGEGDEPAAEAATTTQPQTTTTESQTTTTESQATTTESQTTTTESTTTESTTTQGQAQGDAVAGKAVFTGSAGCSGCHTLADAGATGSVGPNLDELKPPYDKVVTQVTNGGAVMPAFKGTLTEKQIKDVAAYVSSAAG